MATSPHSSVGKPAGSGVHGALARFRNNEETQLIELALVGNQDAVTRIGLRALAGSARCQTALLDALAEALAHREITVAEYLKDAEGISRMAAARGEWLERRRLALLLYTKGNELRVSGDIAPATGAHIESVIHLTRLADEGDDDAVLLLDRFGPHFMPKAVEHANIGIKAVGPLSGPRPDAVPPAPPPPLPRLPEPTRAERLRDWLSYAWWRARYWPGDRWWDLKFFWWGIADRFAAFRGRNDA